MSRAQNASFLMDFELNFSMLLLSFLSLFSQQKSAQNFLKHRLSLRSTKSNVMLHSLHNIGNWQAAVSASVSSFKTFNGMLQQFACIRWWWWWISKLLSSLQKKHWHIWCIFFLSSPDGSPSIGVFVWYLDRNYHRNPATGYQYAVFCRDKRTTRYLGSERGSAQT